MERTKPPKTNVPPEDIYKVIVLNTNNTVKQIIIFGRNSINESNHNVVFSKSELSMIEREHPLITYSEQQIHKDDSLRIIKKKLSYEFMKEDSPSNVTTYNELYLFVNVLQKMQLRTLYQELTRGDNPLSSSMMKQLFINMLLPIEKIDENGKDVYSFEDFVEIMENIHKENPHILSVPFGKKFSNYNDYLFCANPFLLQSENISSLDFIEASESTTNILLSFENQVLLNYSIHENTIYACVAENVLQFANEKEFNSEKIIEYYFPLLFNNSITTMDDLKKEKGKLIEENREQINKKTLLLYNMVDMFYDVHYQRARDRNISYLNRGIIEFHIIIKSSMHQNKLPLEVIFKNIHANQKIPFIKYNPGNRQENIYRLYTQKKTNDGKFIPVLSENLILKLSKEMARSKKISFYLQELDSKEPPIIMDIENNGDVILYSKQKQPMSIEEITQLLIDVANPVIENMNGFLIHTGFKIGIIESLQQSNIDILSLKSFYQVEIQKELNFSKYSNWISCMFDIISENANESILRFKRIDNFQEENENSGFLVKCKVGGLSNKLDIEISGIYHLDFLNVLDMYIDSLLRVTQQPDTTGKVIKDITKLIQAKRVKITKEVDKPHVADIVSTRIIDPIIIKEIQPVQFMMKEKEKEKEEDEEVMDESEEDDDEEGGLFFYDEEEDEEEDQKEQEDQEEQEDQKEQEDQEEQKEEGGGDNNATLQEKTNGGKNRNVLQSFENKSQKKNEIIKNKKKFVSKQRIPRPPGRGGSKEIQDEKSDSSSSDESKESPLEIEKIPEYKINPVGKPLKNPNIFFSMMKERDPALFVSEEDENYEGYSRICQSNLNIQPVVLSESEFKKQDPKTYKDYIRYGSDPSNPYYYICPRYWCLLNNTSMTEDDVIAGKCAKQGVPDKIIPRGEKKVPKDAFVYEFNTPKEHFDQNGNYIYHYPGFKKGKHPKGYGLPCCFKKPKQNWQFNQEEEKAKRGRPLKIKQRDDKDAQNIGYIISNETFPIKQRHRFGFLPISVQKFLQTNNNECIQPSNPAFIKTETECLLRYGIEQYPNQSFMGIVAELYADSNDIVDVEKVPTVKEMRTIMKNAITLDRFIKYNNSYLVSVFRKRPTEEIDFSPFESSEFYKSLNMTDESQRDFLEETIVAYNNFMDYISNDASIINHIYLWDVLTDDNPNLIKGGLNLIIIDIQSNDITDNIKILCPTNSSYKKFDIRKKTVIILKRDEFYEPVYKYYEKDGIISKMKTFYPNTAPKLLKPLMIMIEKTTNKYCSPNPSLPRVYKFKKNIPLLELYQLLKKHGYVVKTQVYNYQYKVIGLVTSSQSDLSKFVFIPCLPSITITELNDIPKEFMDSNNGLWTDYTSTLEQLETLNSVSNGKILCSPKIKVLDGNLIVGILTETNQFVQIEPPSENIPDSLQEVSTSTRPEYYLSADKVITTTTKIDNEREEMIKRISLESQFYSLFRSYIRNFLNKYDNREYKKTLLQLFENDGLSHKMKLKKTIEILRHIVGEVISFDEMEEALLLKIDELSCSQKKCKSADSPESEKSPSSYCIRKEDGKCHFVIPKRHLISGEDNEKIYYARVSDELLRYKRIRLFMTQPKQYLNITNTDYKINPDEFIIIQSTLNSDYLKNLVPFNISSQIGVVNYDSAKPQLSQPYSNEAITLEEQEKLAKSTEVENKLNDNIIECVKETIDIIGNTRDSIWKRIFTKDSKEIIFKNTSTSCTFYILIYMFQDKYKKQISVQSVKTTLWNGYSAYYSKYKDAILKILKSQGKHKIVYNIMTKVYSLETVIMTEEYYITDLDIWIFMEAAKIQACLFSRTKLRGIHASLEWLILGKKYREKHYFIRSPAITTLNQPLSYHLISKSYFLNEVSEFENIVQNAISGRLSEYKDNVQSLSEYLESV